MSATTSSDVISVRRAQPLANSNTNRKRVETRRFVIIVLAVVNAARLIHQVIEELGDALLHQGFRLGVYALYYVGHDRFRLAAYAHGTRLSRSHARADVRLYGEL